MQTLQAAATEETLAPESARHRRSRNAVIDALADGFSRVILISTTESAKSIEDLSRENCIPISTCYRRINELLGQGLLVIERIVITPAGKKYALYRSAIKEVRIEFDSRGTLEVSTTPNTSISDRPHSQ